MRTIKTLFHAALVVMILLVAAGFARATAPTDTTFNVTVSTAGSTLIQLQGSDPDGTPLIFSFNSSPVHGTVSALNSATGYFVYTPTPGYTGPDGIFFVVTSGGQTSGGATCSITVTNQKTRIIDTLVDASGNPRQGKVTFILTQKVTSPAGLIPVGSTVSATLNGSGQFDVSVYPSTSLSPQVYYQVWYEASGGLRREILGVYQIPAAVASITLAPNRVTDTNLAAQYTFLDATSLNTILTANAVGNVTSVNGRVSAIIAQVDDYSWAQINKTTSSLADITTRSASDLNSGTLPNARFPATLPASSGVNLTALNASNLGSGTIPDARFPATLPALNGQNLTDLRASELTGYVHPENLGVGTPSTAMILRGDGTWQTPASFGLIFGTGVAGRLAYWTSSNTLASSPFVRVDGDTTEHRRTGGATSFRVLAGYTSDSNYARAQIDASSTVVIYGVQRAGVESPIPVRLSSLGGGDVQIDNGSVLAEFKSATFQPHTDDVYDFGSSSNRWMNAYIHHAHLGDITLGSDATGDIYYRNSSGNLARLGVGSNGQVLTLASGIPSWAAGGGTAINSTDGVIPYRTSSTTFADSPLVRVDATTVRSGYAQFGSLFTYFAGFQNSAAPTYALLQDSSGETMLNTASSYPLHIRRNNSDIWSFDTSGNLVSSSGTIQINDGGTKPTCDSSKRGMFWTDFGGVGVKDSVEICAKDASNSYAWRTLY